MANLLGANIGTNYKGFLNLDSTINTPLDATLRSITDGMGNASPLQLSTTQVAVNGILTVKSTNPYMDISLTGASAANTGIKAIADGYTTGFYSNATLMLSYRYNEGVTIGSGFRLNFGGITSSFPAIKRNGAAIDFRLADDSDFCTIRGGDGSRLSLMTFDTNGSGRGRIQGLEQIVGISGAGGTRFVSSPDGVLVNSSAQLQADSTTKGFLPPRMTTTQKNAIATPASGLVVYDTTLAKLCLYTTAWETITSI
jgi:hypothetical protein